MRLSGAVRPKTAMATAMMTAMKTSVGQGISMIMMHRTIFTMRAIRPRLTPVFQCVPRGESPCRSFRNLLRACSTDWIARPAS